MPSFPSNQLEGGGVLITALTGGVEYIFNIIPPPTTKGSSYLTFETVRNADGFYDFESPTNALGVFSSSSFTHPPITSPYIFAQVIDQGGGSFIFTPTENIAASSSFLRGTGGIFLDISLTTFNFSVKTDNNGISNDSQFQLPLVDTSTIDAVVSWGDGTSDIITSYNQTKTLHTYPSPGIYNISIDGVINGFAFEYREEDPEEVDDKLKLVNISNWGSFDVSEPFTFVQCFNLTVTATDYPMISSTSLEGMFELNLNLTTLDVSNWGVSSVVYTNSMFGGCASLTTLDVSNWDVSSVTGMGGMFYQCASLTTLDVSNWDVSSVIYMGGIFAFCSSLTSLDVSNWDVSSVVEIGGMFYQCSSLTTLDVSNWDVSSVESMGSMFYQCSSLTTLDVSNWDVSSVTDMGDMFADCSSLTALDVSNWDVSSVNEMGGFLNHSSLTTANYNAALIAFDTLTLQNGVTADFGTSTYTAGRAAATARANIVSAGGDNWTITDGGTA